MPARGRSAAGFTLLELLMVMCIIGCLAALLAPAAGQGLKKVKVVKAVNDCKRVGDAMHIWAIVHGGAPSPTVEDNTINVNNYTPIDVQSLSDVLVPDYLARVPAYDPWGNPYSYFLDVDDPTGPDVALCFSGGSDGSFIDGFYSIEPTHPTDFTADIVWADGNFIRWPG